MAYRQTRDARSARHRDELDCSNSFGCPRRAKRRAHPLTLNWRTSGLPACECARTRLDARYCERVQARTPLPIRPIPSTALNRRMRTPPDGSMADHHPIGANAPCGRTRPRGICKSRPGHRPVSSDHTVCGALKTARPFPIGYTSNDQQMPSEPSGQRAGIMLTARETCCTASLSGRHAPRL